jgi:hypothetical protein
VSIFVERIGKQGVFTRRNRLGGRLLLPQELMCLQAIYALDSKRNSIYYAGFQILINILTMVAC